MKKKNRNFIAPFIVFGLLLLIISSSCKKDDKDNREEIVKDIDGNVYSTVTIGTQVWMVENLKVSRYRNGDTIPNVTDIAEWSYLTTGAFSYYGNNSSNDTIYGKLYNWYAVNDGRNIAPVGWHVPTDTEWTTLKNYLIANGYNYDGTTAGDKITKSLASASLWTPSLIDGAVGNNDYPTYRNKTGFTALPGSCRSSNGTFGEFSNTPGNYGFWWTSTESATTVAFHRGIYFYGSNILSYPISKNYGLSVRCIRD